MNRQRTFSPHPLPERFVLDAIAVAATFPSSTHEASALVGNSEVRAAIGGAADDAAVSDLVSALLGRVPVQA
ncbi:hypothetical protein GCM10010492_69990 [Saccharothrix mutabilis subsp. mutabilis]|uniref:Uncharacterized protein n=2 Tax=Saccharothrix mutabilis TaxID=33921 RepID=A0ABP3ECD9_9PSEU